MTPYEAFAMAWPQPGGLTILVLEATGPAAFATHEGVSSVDEVVW